eukprot:TRINITY_DN17028_c0_g1_i2.p1 TRINITY_DN17028_c0_g1~~TRINITY_DN17028_c0_g1_i2.p1  ORF type:complete len:552 (+),score=47.32 TRINITY_DN17028_c0_g1_i2:31-1686(+)
MDSSPDTPRNEGGRPRAATSWDVHQRGGRHRTATRHETQPRSALERSRRELLTARSRSSSRRRSSRSPRRSFTPPDIPSSARLPPPSRSSMRSQSPQVRFLEREQHGGQWPRVETAPGQARHSTTSSIGSRKSLRRGTRRSTRKPTPIQEYEEGPPDLGLFHWCPLIISRFPHKLLRDGSLRNKRTLIAARLCKFLVIVASTAAAAWLTYTHFAQEEVQSPMITVMKRKLAIPSATICLGQDLSHIINRSDWNISAYATYFTDKDQVAFVVTEKPWKRLIPNSYYEQKVTIYKNGCYTASFTDGYAEPMINYEPGATWIIAYELRVGVGSNMIDLDKKNSHYSCHVGFFDATMTYPHRAPSRWTHVSFGHEHKADVYREDLFWKSTPWYKRVIHKYIYEPSSDPIEDKLKMRLWLRFPEDAFLIQESTAYSSPYSLSALLVLLGLVGAALNMNALFNVCFPYDAPRRVGVPMKLASMNLLTEDPDQACPLAGAKARVVGFRAWSRFFTSRGFDSRFYDERLDDESSGSEYYSDEKAERGEVLYSDYSDGGL